MLTPAMMPVTAGKKTAKTSQNGAGSNDPGEIAGAGDDNAPHIRIRRQFGENIADPGPRRVIERVAFFRAVDGDGGNGAFTVEQNRFGHGTFAEFYGMGLTNTSCGKKSVGKIYISRCDDFQIALNLLIYMNSWFLARKLHCYRGDYKLE